MKYLLRPVGLCLFAIVNFYCLIAQKRQIVTIIKTVKENKVDVFIGGKLFTSFLYPDTLEKPVLHPVYAGNGAIVTRAFPLYPQANEPTDHPHHIGIWFNFENVNGLDFWNNSFAIPKEKKYLYGCIKTDSILKISDGTTGILSYHANWINQNKKTLLEETTSLEFSGTTHQRIIDRLTILKADTNLLFTDAKDGLLGIRLAHELQIPTDKDQKFIDDKGNVTTIPGGTDTIANGNYISSEMKMGDSVWSTRGRWCKVYGKIGSDSVSVVIIDHPSNVNYPTFWHARGYGLFAANPLGEKVFTNGKTSKNLEIKEGNSVSFRFRIIVDYGKNTISAKQLNKLANEFAKK